MVDVSVVPDIYVTISEFVTAHDDGTHTIVRGGIEQWKLAELPADLSFFVFAHVPPTVLTAGKHGFSVRLLTPGGLAVAKVEGDADVVETGASHRILVRLQASIQEYGRFVVEVRMGNAHGNTPLEIRKPDPSRNT